MISVTSLCRAIAMAGFVMPALPAQASEAVHFASETKNPSSKDWVPKGVIIRIDSRTLNAAVLDEFTVEIFKGGALAELSRPTPDRIKLKWKLIGVRDSQDRKQNVDFKMSINTKKMTFTYSGLGEVFFQTPGSAEGRCVALK